MNRDRDTFTYTCNFCGGMRVGVGQYTALCSLCLADRFEDEEAPDELDVVIATGPNASGVPSFAFPQVVQTVAHPTTALVPGEFRIWNGEPVLVDRCPFCLSGFVAKRDAPISSVELEVGMPVELVDPVANDQHPPVALDKPIVVSSGESNICFKPDCERPTQHAGDCGPLRSTDGGTS